MKKNKVFVGGMLAALLTFGIMIIGCPTEGEKENTDSTTSYTYTSGMYVITIAKTNRESNLSMKGMYPSLSYKNGILARTVLSDGETASYTLKYNGVVVSSGYVLMGTTHATFTPSSGKPGFTGTFSSEAELTISSNITLDNGTQALLGTMQKATDQVAAFTEFWGVWRANIEGTNVTLTIGNGVWDILIGGEPSSGTYIQTSATTADIKEYTHGFNGAIIGHVVTHPNTTMVITLYNNTAYPGTYNLRR
jgi:hypothetical protein